MPASVRNLVVCASRIVNEREVLPNETKTPSVSKPEGEEGVEPE